MQTIPSTKLQNLRRLGTNATHAKTQMQRQMRGLDWSMWFFDGIVRQLLEHVQVLEPLILKTARLKQTQNWFCPAESYGVFARTYGPNRTVLAKIMNIYIYIYIYATPPHGPWFYSLLGMANLEFPNLYSRNFQLWVPKA